MNHNLSRTLRLLTFRLPSRPGRRARRKILEQIQAKSAHPSSQGGFSGRGDPYRHRRLGSGLLRGVYPGLRSGARNDGDCPFAEKALAFQAREDGAVLVEAALVLPILIMMLAGMFEFSQAYTASRDVADVVATTADLVSQVPSVSTSNTAVSAANLQDIAQVSNNLMAPFSVTPLTLTIQSISEAANGNVTLAWTCTWTSISASPACTTPGSTYSSLPAGLIAPGQCLIMAKASYTFKPAVGEFLLGGVTFAPVAYFKPRITACVTLVM